MRLNNSKSIYIWSAALIFAVSFCFLGWKYLSWQSLLEIWRGITTTDLIAIVALMVSIFSLSTSLAGHLRDRPRLVMQVNYCSSENNYLGHIEVKIVNAGRRPACLVKIWGREGRSAAFGMQLGSGGSGIRLQEHEFKIIQLSCLPRGRDDFEVSTMDDDAIYDFDSMWIEDALGGKHPIPYAKDLLPRLRKDYKDWCEYTNYWKSNARLDEEAKRAFDGVN